MSIDMFNLDPSVYDSTLWQPGTAIPRQRPVQQPQQPTPYEFSPRDQQLNPGAPPVPAPVSGPTRNARGSFAREVAYSRPKAQALVQALALKRGGQA